VIVPPHATYQAARRNAECQGQPGYDIPCSCGYGKLMKELEESK